MAGLAWCVVADDVFVAVWLASGIVLRPCRQSNTQMLWVSNHRVVKRGHLKRQVIRNCFKYTTITLNCISINHFLFCFYCTNLIQKFTDTHTKFCVWFVNEKLVLVFLFLFERKLKNKSDVRENVRFDRKSFCELKKQKS